MFQILCQSVWFGENSKVIPGDSMEKTMSYSFYPLNKHLSMLKEHIIIMAEGNPHVNLSSEFILNKTIWCADKTIQWSRALATRAEHQVGVPAPTLWLIITWNSSSNGPTHSSSSSHTSTAVVYSCPSSQTYMMDGHHMHASQAAVGTHWHRGRGQLGRGHGESWRPSSFADCRSASAIRIANNLVFLPVLEEYLYYRDRIF